MLEKTTRMNYLLDFYQVLLTPKQRKYMEMYYLEDYSLGEISEIAKVSRQAVYDNIKRTESLLESYEEKLQLYGKYTAKEKLMDLIELLIEQDEIDRILEIFQEIKELE